MKIPDFLRPSENDVPCPEFEEFREMVKKYEEHFGVHGITTEPASYTRREWIDILKRCIEEDITLFEMLPGELETGEEIIIDGKRCIGIIE